MYLYAFYVFLAIQDYIFIATTIMSYIYKMINKNIESLLHTIRFLFWIDITHCIIHFLEFAKKYSSSEQTKIKCNE